MKRFHPLPGLLWVKHGEAVLIVNEEGNAQILTEAEAALWRWLNQSFSWQDLLDLYSALLSVPIVEGETHLLETLQKWVTTGLLEVHSG